jgi:hypothetical protein
VKLEVKDAIHSLRPGAPECSLEANKARLTGLFPVLEWLPGYSVARHLLPDVIAGLTLSVMHVPQGSL